MAQEGPQAPGLTAAAGQEQAEMVTEQDTILLEGVTAFREWLASTPRPTQQEARQMRQAAKKWGLVDQRLAGDAKRTQTVAQIIAAAAQPFPEQAVVLKSQAVALESIALSVRLQVAILEANAEIAERLKDG